MAKIEVSSFAAVDFQAAEAFKTLRTNILFSGADTKAIGLTSFSEGEGKSTVAFQLAASLAQAGKKVLLIDADLRKSVLAARLKVTGKVQGLSHLLSGMANIKDLLNTTDIPGLYILFAGARVPNSAELLGCAGFPKLIGMMKDVFDYVIVDVAPLGQVVDCAVIASVLDGILMVIDTTNNSYRLQKRLKGQLEKAGGKILGVVLNRVDYNDKSGYYGKAYGYGYDEKA